MLGLAAVLGSSLITGLLGANAQKEAANKAAAAQAEANRQALAAQQQNFNQGLAFQTNQQNQGNALAQLQQQRLQSIFGPLLGAGNTAIGGLGSFGQGGLQAFQQQLGLSGALGADAQQQAISGIENSPLFNALAKQGETGILSAASATGGLRGGNVQQALAQNRQQLLGQQVQQQFQNLGGLAGLGSQNFGALGQLGQSGASGLAQGGLGILGAQLGLGGQIAGNVAQLGGANTQAITGLLGQQGQIQANNALAQGAATAGLFNGLNGAVRLGTLLGGFGGIGAPAQTPTYIPGQQLGLSGLGVGEGQSLLNILGAS